MIVFLLYKGSHHLVLKVDSEVHVAKKEFVIMIALILHIGQTEILESLIINLSDILEPLSQRLLIRPGSEMHIDHREGGVLKIEPNADSTLISCYSREPTLYHDFSEELYAIFVLDASEHNYKAANH